MVSSRLLHWNLLLISFLYSVVVSSSENPCSSIVPQAWDKRRFLPPQSLLLQFGYFQAHGKFPGQVASSHRSDEEPTVQLFADYISTTTINGVLHVKASLVFTAKDTPVIPSRSRHQSDAYWMGKGGFRGGVRRFDLDGHWSQPDGVLCMTGTGASFSGRGNFTIFHSLLILRIPKNPTIFDLVRGTLNRTDSGSDSFDSISILAYNQNDRHYTLMPEAKKACSGGSDGNESLSIGSNQDACYVLGSLMTGFQLEYESNCVSKNCNPLGKDLGYLPQFMDLNVIGCLDDGKIHLYLTFSNSSVFTNNPPFLPNVTFVGEGFWDGEKNQLCAIACRIMNSGESLEGSFVGDCSVGMSFKFLRTLSVRNRSRIVGEIWSNKSRNDTGYFEKIFFQSLESHFHFPNLKYRYTKLDQLMKSSSNVTNSARNSKKRYPNPASNKYDMKFFMHGGANNTLGFFPLFIGDSFQDYYAGVGFTRYNANSSDSSQKLWNVSYVIQYTMPSNTKWSEILSFHSRSHRRLREISAEGIYDSDTGLLCMVGCRYLPLKMRNSSETSNRYDCKISINVQFPPFNPSIEEQFKGSITSTRNDTDLLYFEPLEFFSHVPYARQARRAIKRIDFEITVVLVSLSLACVFIGSQIFYVKRHSDALPSISILMLVVLTLGMMIPLVLNFEALFNNGERRNKKSVILRSGGLLEVNEVIVRIITMLAFLMEFWLLQLVVSAKLAKKVLLSSEGKVLKWCLPLYLVGGFVTWSVHLAKTNGSYTPFAHHSLWEYLLSYAGLVLDGFLLPQVLLNIFSNSKGKSLAVSFYVGMSLVRAMPHLYDAYRTRSYLLQFEESYMYANPKRDFYSSTWDAVIPCGGVVLAVLIFVQQRFGGSSMVPRSFRRFTGYEQVSATDGSGLRAEVECS